MTKSKLDLALSVLALTLLLASCGGEGGRSSGRVEMDGSSTVGPISEAAAEEYMLGPGGGLQVTVGISGTGGGFKRFCAGETDISNASRPITPGERELCAQNGVEWIEVPVALDGLAVVTNPAVGFASCLTVDELRRIWEPGSTVARWSDVRPEWPAEPLKLYGPGTNSGTFDYFTEAVMGTARSSRPDYSASEDDNVLVQGVEGDRSALAYFGFAYYRENRTKLKVLAVDGGAGCVEPTDETVRSGEYSPLSRPLFIYVSRAALVRPEVREFVTFYLESAVRIVPETGYVPMPDAEYRAALARLAR